MSVITDETGSFWYLEGFIDSRRQTWRTVIDTLPLIVGRTARAGLQLFSGSVSHRHAELFRQEGRLWIRDLGSTNGTRVNLEAIDLPMALGEGNVAGLSDPE